MLEGLVPNARIRTLLPFLCAAAVAACSAPPVDREESSPEFRRTPLPPGSSRGSTPDTRDGGRPAPPPPQSCRLEDPFGPMKRIDELVSYGAERRATLSADELTIVFEREVSD